MECEYCYVIPEELSFVFINTTLILTGPVLTISFE